MSIGMKTLSLLLLLSALAACSSSPGQPSAAADASTDQPAAAADAPQGEAADGAEAAAHEAAVAAAFDPVKCVRYTPSGTRISQKVCKKQSEWDRLKEKAQRDMADAQRRSGHENQTL